jgi:ComF family protein
MGSGMGETSEFDAIDAGESRAAGSLWLKRGLGWLSDVVFPPVCLSCRRALLAHDALCPKCWSKIDFIRAPLCDRLGSPLPYDTGGTMISAAAAADPPDYARARAVGHYTGALRELIHDFKFSDRHAVRAMLARLMSDAGADLLAQAEVIVPVPLSRRRLLSRRFNQAALLAKTVARTAGLPYEPLALVRTRATPPQVGLTRNERKLNVRGVFAVPDRFRPRLAGKRVVLIDDVVTTGATCGAAARALMKAGAVSVDVLALALVTDKAMMEAS